MFPLCYQFRQNLLSPSALTFQGLSIEWVGDKSTVVHNKKIFTNPCFWKWNGGRGWGWKCTLASLEAQMEKNLPAMQETRVLSLGQEDPLEKEMATHSSILAWRILWTEEPGSLQSMGSQRVRHDWVTNTHPQNKNPLHWWPHSCPHNEDGAMPEAPRAWFDYVPTTL